MHQREMSLAAMCVGWRRRVARRERGRRRDDEQGHEPPRLRRGHQLVFVVHASILVDSGVGQARFVGEAGSSATVSDGGRVRAGSGGAWLSRLGILSATL